MKQAEPPARARTLAIAAALALVIAGCTGSGSGPGSSGAAGAGAPSGGTPTAGPTAAGPSGASPVAAPSAEPGASPAPSAAAPSRTIPRISLPAPSVDLEAVPESVLAAVRADAAKRTGVAEGDIVLLRAEATVWSSGALGCPVPGQLYTQSLVPGYWVVVGAGGTTIDYRLTQSGAMKVCDNPPGPG
jgi:hypothetical protein